jgi:hypothetical protein
VKKIKHDDELELPFFSIWMPQLFLKKRMSESADPTIQEISRLFLPDGMPAPEKYPTDASNPFLEDKDFTKWMRQLDNVTLWQWEARNKYAALRAWFSEPQNAFLQKWLDRTAIQWLLWSWMLEHGTELRTSWMPCPEQYVSFLIQSMTQAQTLPQKSFLKKWFSENNSFADWLIKNNYGLTEFDGRKILVEEVRDKVYNPDGDALVLRHKKEEDVMTLEPAAEEPLETQKKEKVLVLRDYDKEELSNILSDSTLYEILRFRMQLDAQRLKKLMRSLQKQKSQGQNTNEDALKFRVDRDASRWGLKK